MKPFPERGPECRIRASGAAWPILAPLNRTAPLASSCELSQISRPDE